MSEQGKERRWRPVPCPSWEVAELEQWLSDLAEEGYFLAETGIFFGFACFERGEPRSARYRLEPAQQEPTLRNNAEEPEPEAQALNEAFGWEFVTRHREFYIYRTFDPLAPELNTDSVVQAMALKAVRRRRMIAVITTLLSLLPFWFMIELRGLLLLTTAIPGMLFPLAMLCILWTIAKALREFLALNRLYQQLKRGEPPVPKGNWRRCARLYLVRRGVYAALYVYVIAAGPLTVLAELIG